MLPAWKLFIRQRMLGRDQNRATAEAQTCHKNSGEKRGKDRRTPRDVFPFVSTGTKEGGLKGVFFTENKTCLREEEAWTQLTVWQDHEDKSRQEMRVFRQSWALPRMMCSSFLGAFWSRAKARDVCSDGPRSHRLKRCGTEGHATVEMRDRERAH